MATRTVERGRTASAAKPGAKRESRFTFEGGC